MNDCSTSGYLKNPAERPQQLVLAGTNAAGKTSLFFPDACGLSVNAGAMGTDTGVQMTVTGLSVAILQQYLQTHALIIGGYNFETTVASTLTNNLNLVYANLDGDYKLKKLFSAKSVSNMQQNPLLLNVVQPFVFTNATGLKIATPDGTATAVTYTFTFDIIDAVPYGKLDDYLMINKIPSKSATC